MCVVAVGSAAVPAVDAAAVGVAAAAVVFFVDSAGGGTEAVGGES